MGTKKKKKRYSTRQTVWMGAGVADIFPFSHSGRPGGSKNEVKRFSPSPLHLGMKRRTWGDSWLCVSMCAILSTVTRVKKEKGDLVVLSTASLFDPVVSGHLLHFLPPCLFS